MLSEDFQPSYSLGRASLHELLDLTRGQINNILEVVFFKAGGEFDRDGPPLLK